MNFCVDNFEKLHGVQPEFELNGVSQSSNLKNNTIAFALQVDNDLINALKLKKSIVIFIPLNTNLPQECSTNNLILECVNPRYEYIKTTRHVFKQDNVSIEHELNYVHPTAKIGKSVVLSPFTYIGPNCIIEDDCNIFPGAKILSKVKIGKGTQIGSNTVIGGIGFGIERDNGKEREVISFGGDPLKMPHFGGVEIGNNCDIGALTTICSGAIEPTILEDYVMVDDHVHIAHNCKIKRGAAIVACAEVSGSVQVGEEAWISPNSSVMQKISIGPRCIVGLGAVVLKSTPADSIYIGNPAKPLGKIKKK